MMKMSRYILLMLSAAFMAVEAAAQQDAMFTHYMYNTLVVNPAYAGSRDALTLTALHRSQWVGFPGAPMTQTLTAHTPFRKENIGLGMSIMNDNIGKINNSSIYFDFAYRIRLDKKSMLSLGLKGGINVFRAKFDDLTTIQINDQSFQSAGAAVAPNFGFGAYYTRDRFYAGISTPRLLENNFRQGGSSVVALKEQRHYFFIAGYQFKLSNTLELKPTSFVKMTLGAPVEADLSASLIWKKMLHIGAMFRTGDAFGVLAGYNITNQLFLSYSFDWSYALQTVRYHGGSHEIMLRYDFIFTPSHKAVSPRYF